MKHKQTTILIATMAVFVLLWGFFMGFTLKQPGSFFNKGNNAVWLEHKWVGEAQTEQEINDLVNRFRKYQIKTVFVHAGPFREDGTIAPETYAHASRFIETAKRFDKNIQYQAWLGQLRGKIDLADPNVRHNMVREVLTFCELIGFDGVHIDIEPVWDEDDDFIGLLKEIREELGEEKVLSVALVEFIPESLLWLTEKIHKFENYNTEKNYRRVGEYADQIAVMAYDTGINRDWLYSWLVKEQTIWVTALLDNTQIFIGLPAYEDVKEGFNPEVENLENGLRGLVKGLNNLRSREKNFAGVAIYSYWEMDLSEWATYEDLWLK